MQNRTSYISDPVLTTTDMQNIQTELETIITEFGGTLSGADLGQASKYISNAIAASTYYVDTGAVNSYILNSITGMRGITSYEEGAIVRFRAMNTNTGASTINILSLGVKSIFRADGVTALSAGDISSDHDCILRYNGTNFILVSFGTLAANNFIGNFIGVDQIIYENILTSDIATLTIPLPEELDTYKIIKLYMDIRIASSSDLWMRWNNDSANKYLYGVQQQFWDTAETSKNASSNGVFDNKFSIDSSAGSPGDRLLYDITISENYYTGVSSCHPGGTGFGSSGTLGGFFNSNLRTSIDLFASGGGNDLLTGSVIRAYAKSF